MLDNYHSFSDFSHEEEPLEGKKRRVDEVLNARILITDFRVAGSKYNERNYATIQFKNGDDTYVVFTGSEVLINQMERYKDKIPFYSTIVKQGRYFTLS